MEVHTDAATKESLPQEELLIEAQHLAEFAQRTLNEIPEFREKAALAAFWKKPQIEFRRDQGTVAEVLVINYRSDPRGAFLYGSLSIDRDLIDKKTNRYLKRGGITIVKDEEKVQISYFPDNPFTKEAQKLALKNTTSAVKEVRQFIGSI